MPELAYIVSHNLAICMFATSGCLLKHLHWISSTSGMLHIMVPHQVELGKFWTVDNSFHPVLVCPTMLSIIAFAINLLQKSLL